MVDTLVAFLSLVTIVGFITLCIPRARPLILTNVGASNIVNINRQAPGIHKVLN